MNDGPLENRKGSTVKVAGNPKATNQKEINLEEVAVHLLLKVTQVMLFEVLEFAILSLCTLRMKNTSPICKVQVYLHRIGIRLVCH